MKKMIWTPLTAIMIILGFSGVVLMLYAGPKAYSIIKKISKASLEEKYELEKSFYLISTVIWVLFIVRIIASVLFWATNESLIPLIPGAMCQFGVNQAGAPWSWIDNGVKLIVLLVYGNWLVLDLINRRVKGAPLMKSLSKLFLVFIPLIVIDVFLDLAFYFTVSPVVVPCCRVVFTAESPVPCPYCFIFHDAPLFIAVISGYGLSICFTIWGFVVKHYTLKYKEIEEVGTNVMRKLAILALGFAILGTVVLIPAIIQVMSPAVPVH